MNFKGFILGSFIRRHEEQPVVRYTLPRNGTNITYLHPVELTLTS